MGAQLKEDVLAFSFIFLFLRSDTIGFLWNLELKDNLSIVFKANKKNGPAAPLI